MGNADDRSRSSSHREWCRVAGSSRSPRGAWARRSSRVRPPSCLRRRPDSDAQAAWRVLPQAESADGCRHAVRQHLRADQRRRRAHPRASDGQAVQRPGGAGRVVLSRRRSSDHNALDGGFKLVSAAVVDHGWVAICQTAGGTLYSHPTAAALQVAGYDYMKPDCSRSRRTFCVRRPPAAHSRSRPTRASSSPRSPACTTSTRAYDIRAHYDARRHAQASIIAAFGDDPVAIDAANPARHPAVRLGGIHDAHRRRRSPVRVRPDRAARRATVWRFWPSRTPVAAEATMRAHSNGHSTPGFALPDFVAYMERWVAERTRTGAGDRTPSVRRFRRPRQRRDAEGLRDRHGHRDRQRRSRRRRRLPRRDPACHPHEAVARPQWGARIWTPTSQRPTATTPSRHVRPTPPATSASAPRSTCASPTDGRVSGLDWGRTRLGGCVWGRSVSAGRERCRSMTCVCDRHVSMPTGEPSRGRCSRRPAASRERRGARSEVRHIQFVLVRHRVELLEQCVPSRGVRRRTARRRGRRTAIRPRPPSTARPTSGTSRRRSASRSSTCEWSASGSKPAPSLVRVEVLGVHDPAERVVDPRPVGGDRRKSAALVAEDAFDPDDVMRRPCERIASTATCAYVL